MDFKKNLLKLFLIFFPLFLSAEEAVDLLIKMSVRSHPDEFKVTLQEYYEKLSGEHTYHFLITLDEDNPALNTEEMLQFLSVQQHLTYLFVKGLSTIEIYNSGLNQFEKSFKLLLLVSEVVVPVEKNFDRIIFRRMTDYFPAYDGIIFIPSSMQNFPETMSIAMGQKFYKAFNYIVPPVYSGIEIGLEELRQVGRILGKSYSNAPLFITNHHYREDSIENDAQNEADRLMFKSREEHNFNIDEAAYRRLLTKEWSILICTLEERQDVFSRIFEKLNRQIAANGLQDKIEVLYFCDNREKSVGYKRDILMHQSQGFYVNYIDDDDDVHDDYIKMIFEALMEKPDVVSLVGIITFDGLNPKYFIHSLDYNSYFEENRIYYRPPNHLNTMKRSVASLFNFLPISNGEDTDWAMRICISNLLQSQVTIHEPYYFYLYNVNK